MSTVETTFLAKGGRRGAAEGSRRSAVGEALIATAVSHEVRERRLRIRRVEYLASHDILTDFVNRAALLDRLSRALQHASERGNRVAVLLLDIDDFRHINDSLGHAAGDDALVEVAVRLRRSVRRYDVVARLGGDVFIVLLNVVTDRREAMVVAERLVAAVKAPLPLRGHVHQVTASVGIATSHARTTGADELLRLADAALHQAKHQGTTHIVIANQPVEP